MKVEFGNAGSIDTSGTGWFIGFSEWTQRLDHLRHVAQEDIAKSLCVKWFSHSKGDPDGEPKPISEGRTISILVSEAGRFRLEFSVSPEFPKDSSETFVLRAHGDYVIWGEGVFHRAFGDEASTILTLRWISGTAAV